MKIASISYCPPCYPGSDTLPPVNCRSYTGRMWQDIGPDDLRGEFVDDFFIGRIDAPSHIPAGSHRAPRITINGRVLIPTLIYPYEIAREALS